jgi:hypothetical protein
MAIYDPNLKNPHNAPLIIGKMMNKATKNLPGGKGTAFGLPFAGKALKAGGKLISKIPKKAKMAMTTIATRTRINAYSTKP